MFQNYHLSEVNGDKKTISQGPNLNSRLKNFSDPGTKTYFNFPVSIVFSIRTIFVFILLSRNIEIWNVTKISLHIFK